MDQKIPKILFSIGIFILYFVFFIFIFFLIIPYIHESGHIFLGFSDGIIKGEINRFSISVWQDHPFFPFIKLPQQTKILQGTPSFNFILGGPIFTIFVFLWLSFIGYFNSKEKKWFLIFIGVFIFEISGNIICGTDNFYNNTLSFCNHQIDVGLQLISIFLFSGTFSYFVTRKIISLIYKKIIK